MGTMQFKDYLTEELATGSLEKAGNIILKYLRKKTGFKSMFANLGLEKFKNSNGAGYGLRFYAPGKKIESIILSNQWAPLDDNFCRLVFH